MDRRSNALAISWPTLSLMFLLIGLGISRLSLILHEFVGHGLVAVGLGGEITTFRLHVFGGGWVRHHRATPLSDLEHIWISVAGIGAELILAAVLLLWLRRLRVGSSLHLTVLAFAGVNAIHALFYLTVGTHHGLGDGRRLHVMLGEARWWLVAPAALLVVTVGFVFARRFVGVVRGWLGHLSPAIALLTIVAAIGVAAGGHLGLMVAERALTSDQAFAEIMRTQNDRLVTSELQTLVEEREAAGETLTESQVAAARAQLQAQHRVFPLRTVLVLALVAALGLGAFLGIRKNQEPRDSRPSMKPALVLFAAGMLLLLSLNLLS